MLNLREKAWHDLRIRREVLTAPNREIAAELYIAEKTAGNHAERVYAKLGVNNRTQASLAAIDQGSDRLPG